MTGPRTYDPVVGRFLQGDPLVVDSDVACFVYSSGGPVGRRDAVGYADEEVGAGAPRLSEAFAPPLGGAAALRPLARSEERTERPVEATSFVGPLVGAAIETWAQSRHGFLLGLAIQGTRDVLARHPGVAKALHDVATSTPAVVLEDAVFLRAITSVFLRTLPTAKIGAELPNPPATEWPRSTVGELVESMNRRPGTVATWATGEEDAYLRALGAEGSHMLLEGGRSSILLRPDVATRWTAMHEWLHRALQRRVGGPSPGEDLFIEAFLERHTRLFGLEAPVPRVKE